MADDKNIAVVDDHLEEQTETSRKEETVSELLAELETGAETKPAPEKRKGGSPWICRRDVLVREEKEFLVMDCREGNIVLMDKVSGAFIIIPATTVFSELRSGTARKNGSLSQFEGVFIDGKEIEKAKERAKVLEGVLDDLYPDWNKIYRKSRKPCLEIAAMELGISKSQLRRDMLEYLKSGRDPMSLIDRRLFNKRKKSLKTVETVDKGEVDRDVIFTYGLKKFKELKNVQAAYDEVCDTYFRRYDCSEDKVIPLPLEESDVKISYKQLYNYINSHLGELTAAEYKKGKREVRNNERVLHGKSDTGVTRVGQLYEIDECKLPIEIISPVTGENVGQAVAYVVIDVKAVIIVGLYVGYEDNSYLGYSNAMMSLLEDHNKQSERYGVSFDEYEFPSFVIPERVRVDRGAEYTSHAFVLSCSELGIGIDYEPVAIASLKGCVESIHRRLQEPFKRYAKGSGTVGTEYQAGKKARKKACMTLESIRRVLYQQIKVINTSVNDSYQPDLEQMEADIVPTPAEIYKFECERSGDPRNVFPGDVSRILYSLMARVEDKRKFSYSRKGILYSGHNVYFSIEEPWFDEMIGLISKEKMEAPEVRYSGHTMDAVYITYKGVIRKVPLASKREAQDGYRTLSWDEFDERLKKFRNNPGRKEAEKKTDIEKKKARDAVKEEVRTGKALKKDVETEDVKAARKTAKDELYTRDDEARNRLLDAVSTEDAGALPDKTEEAPAALPEEAPSVQETQKTEEKKDQGVPVTAASRGGRTAYLGYQDDDDFYDSLDF